MKSYAQAAQDMWVIEQHGNEPGYYVDVGAYDGVEHSNTLALQERGWQGMCIEPNGAAFAFLTQNRGVGTCLIDQACAGHAGIVQMEGDTVVSFGPWDDRSIHCNTLPHFLETCNAPPTIDYISLDTEGCELQILMAMDFNRWEVRLMTVEHNLYRDGPANKNAIFELLTARGFERAMEDVVAPGYGPYEDWYVNARM
jgi:FkbM family methyltransferase